MVATMAAEGLVTKPDTPTPTRTRARFMNCRACKGQAYVPTNVEHLANMVTHGLWVLPSFVGLVWMLYLAANETQFNSALIYGIATFCLFTVSTTFHTISYTGQKGMLKNFFHIGDRAVIYIFIAASYTPWLLLKDFRGWSAETGYQTMCIVWVMAVLGILYQYTFHEQYKWLETLFYLIIGICPSIVVMAMTEVSGMHEVAMGGMVYVCGVVFFKMDGVIPFAHAIWHCFVFVGATLHYCAVCKYLLGSPPLGLQQQLEVAES